MSLHEEIQAAINIICEAITNHDTERAVSMYTDNACLLPGNGSLLRGRKEITDYINNMSKQGVIGAKCITTKVEAEGQVAFEVGSYEFFLQSSENSEQSVIRGEYMMVWKRVNEAWRVYRDCFSVLTSIDTKKTEFISPLN